LCFDKSDKYANWPTGLADRAAGRQAAAGKQQPVETQFNRSKTLTSEPIKTNAAWARKVALRRRAPGRALGQAGGAEQSRADIDLL